MRYLNTLIITAAAVALVSCGGGGGGSASTTPVVVPTNVPGVSPAALTTLPEVDSVNGVATVTLQAAFDASSRPKFFWQGQEVAPTIRVKPGDTINLTFQNNLPEFCDVGVVSNANLHFHGLSSAPVAPGDEVIATNASPGATVNYQVVINPDQPPGLYWYHPHAHGLASYEVGNGMAGAIVVEGIGNAVPQTAGLRERVIVLNAIPNDNSFAAGEDSVLRRGGLAGKRRSTTVRSPQDVDGDNSGGNSCGPDTETTPMLNGAPLASIGIKPGETELFRVINATGHRFFDLAIDGKQLTLVSQDGVPLGTYPGAPSTIVANDVLIPPAGRSEFLVTGGSSPAALVSNCVKTGPAGDPAPEVALGVLTDDSKWPGQSTAIATAKRVQKLSSIQTSSFYHSVLPAPAQQRLVQFDEDSNGFYLNKQQYNPTGPPMFTVQSGTTEEWTLQNNTQELHAFHIHQTHFLVESVNGVAVSNPHWEDTVTINPAGAGVSGQTVPSQTKVLIDFRDPTIRGTFLFHCHILDHEDGGMMAKVAVI